MVTKRKNPTYLIASLAAALFLQVGCQDKAADQQVAGPPPAVTVVEAKQSQITPSTSFTGRVEAVDSVELRARVTGYLVERHFEEGQDVNAGDLLFVIEKANYQAQVDQVRGAIERLKGSKKLAEIERDRRAKLVKRKAISQEELDIANAKLTEVNGDLISQQALLTRAELDLSYTDVKAPIAGKIGLTPYSAGDFVGPESGLLAEVVSQDPVYVTFPVTQREVLAIVKEAEQKGTDPTKVAIKVQLADGSFYDQIGELNFVDIVANPGTDTIQIRGQFPNPDGRLIHRQLVNVVVEQSEQETAVTIPQSALQFDQAGRYVLMVDEENKVVVQRIETGVAVGSEIVVSQGLREGQKVITVGIQKVRPGVVVEPTVASASGS